VEEYDKLIAGVKVEEEELHKEKTSLLATRLQMESFQNVKYNQVIAELNERIQRVEDKLQEMRERRVTIKETVVCNRFSDEGNQPTNISKTSIFSVACVACLFVCLFVLCTWSRCCLFLRESYWWFVRICY
jgi:dsDNA-specific endonuclease/ATPase MutS2